jgi:hypothetical protein
MIEQVCKPLTMNEYALRKMSADKLFQIISDAPAESNESSMHHGRALVFLKAIINATCELRDLGKLEITKDNILYYLQDENALALVQSDDIKDSQAMLAGYLSNLPQIDIKELPTIKRIPEKASVIQKLYREYCEQKVNASPL